MKIHHVVTILGIWATTSIGAVILREPAIYLAPVLGTLLIVIALAIEVSE